MKIQSLLNPFCGDNHGYRSSESPTPAPMPMSRSMAPYGVLTKRQKVPKDAPIFSEGTKTIGFVNYPPYEAGDDYELIAQHQKFQVFPLGEIFKKGVRHIPYNSDKKDFLEKTGRDAFEMFQYTYRVPGEEKEYVVVWDYNVGLVRMTPFFKSLKYSKTVPAKALRENSGLKDISYSITGGALVCQGYWMPYQAAKAVAATFCYNIRWALTPVFGNDFPGLCLRPKDPNFAKFLIDPDIVRSCTEETNRFRVEGASYKVLSSLYRTPRNQFETPPWSPRTLHPERPRTSEESSYGTESDYSDKYLFSPQVSPKSTTWTSINGSQSPVSPPALYSSSYSPPHRYLPPLQRVLPTSVPGGYYGEPARTKRTHSKVAYGGGGIARNYYSRPQTATSSPETDSDPGLDDCGDGVHTQNELDAAQVIMQLSAVDQGLPPNKRTRRGSQE